MAFPGGASGKEFSCQCRSCGGRSLCQEDPLEEEMAPHSSVLAGRISWTEEHGGLQFMMCRSQRRLSIWAHKNWQPGTLGPLAFSDGLHSVECVSPKGPLTFWDKLCSAFGICSFLNKHAFTLLWLTVEFFPAWNQGPTLGSQSQGLLRSWDMTLRSCPSSSCNNMKKMSINLSSYWCTKKKKIQWCYRSVHRTIHININ